MVRRQLSSSAQCWVPKGSAALQWLEQGANQTGTEALGGPAGTVELQTDATASTRGSEACCESNSESAGPEDTLSSTGDARDACPARPRASTVQRAAVAEEDGASAGTVLLRMLRPPGGCARAHTVHREPQPLSTDEYALWSMQAREDREAGADTANTDTFGDDAVLRGWSFEENLAANERIANETAIYALEPQAQQQSYERWWLPDRQGAPAQPLQAAFGDVEQHLYRLGWSPDCQGAPPQSLEAAIGEVERLQGAVHEAVELVEIQPASLKKVIHLVVSSGWSHITWRRDYTALHLAAECGRPDVVPLLVVMRGDLEAKDSRGRTPADVAKSRGRDVAAFSPLQPACLAAKKLDELASDAGGGQDCWFTPKGAILQWRCLSLALAKALNLLPLEPQSLRAAVMFTAAGGAGVLSWQTQHTTCLHLAAELRRDDLMPLLIALRADPDVPDCAGRTALDVATARKHWPSVWAMLKSMRDGGPKPGGTTAMQTSGAGERVGPSPAGTKSH